MSLPPVKDCASTSAVKAILGLQPLCLSSARCSPSTFLHLPYRKLCRMSEVITSDSDRLGHLNPDLRARASVGSTEPMLQDVERKKKKGRKKEEEEEEEERGEIPENESVAQLQVKKEGVDTQSCSSVPLLHTVCA